MKSLKVRDYMAVDLITFTPRSKVMDAMAVFLDRGISGAPVLADGVLVGVLSEVDLIEVVVQDSYYNENLGIVADFMQTEVEWVEPERWSGWSRIWTSLAWPSVSLNVIVGVIQ